MVSTPAEGSLTTSSNTSSSNSVPELSKTFTPSVTAGTPNFANATGKDKCLCKQHL